jgi:hypothetical protein
MEKNFKPLDLNVATVGRLFNNCLYTSESKNHTAAIFHQTSMGYPKDSDPVFFDKDAIDANRDLINFLLGQLNDAHRGPLVESTVQTLFMKYAGEPWTKDGITLLKLIHLALANSSMAPFSAEKDRTLLKSYINPTLSPKDPNFPEWWEQNKSKWEER